MAEPTPAEQALAIVNVAETVAYPGYAVAECGQCGRSSWDTGAIGRLDEMTQPNGQPCGGTFRAVPHD